MKNILITADDGYDSEGIEILVEALRDDYNLKISATKEQQSGVGAKINFHHGGTVEKIEHLGVETLVVDGSPVDSVEIAKRYWNNVEFDLVVSGMNYGPNIGNIITSGTVSAAFMSLIMNISQKAIALSFKLNPHHWLLKDKPGIKQINTNIVKRTKQVVEMCIENDYFGSNLLNINFPAEDTTKIQFTKLFTNIYDYYNLVELEETTENKYKFSYPKSYKKDIAGAKDYDVIALENETISITPLLTDLTNFEIYNNISTQNKFELPN